MQTIVEQKIPESSKQNKLTFQAIQHTLGGVLRNQQESRERVKEQIQLVRAVGGWMCPFLPEFLQIQRKQEVVKVFTQRQTCKLAEYIKKELPNKRKLQLIVQILEGLIQLDAHQYGIVLLSASRIGVSMQDGQPTISLNVLDAWKYRSSDMLLASRQLFLSENKLYLSCIPPQFHSDKSTSIDIYRYQLWSVSILILQILWSKEDFKIDYTTKGSKYCLSQIQTVNCKYQPTAIKKTKFHLEDQCLESVLGGLWIEPSRRTSSLPKLRDLFRKALIQRQPTVRLDLQTIKQFNQSYLQKLNSKVQPRIESKQFILLTPQIRNKLIGYLQSKKLKISKSQPFRKHYKASLNKFSSRAFHQKCDGLKNHLTIFQTTDHRKFCAYSPVAFDLERLQTIFGLYVMDQTNLSFIYSSNQDEFFTLKESGKAIGVGMNFGPVFGQTDIVVVDGNITNLSRLKSYHPVNKGSKAKLTTQEVFSLLDYEMYQVMLDK